MNSSNLPEQSKMEIQLRQRLDAVLSTSPQSAERAKTMSRLIDIVQRLPGIKKVAHQDYLLALNLTWEWMSKNIDQFLQSTNSLENDLVKWINGYLYWRIRDIYHPPVLPIKIVSLDSLIFDEGESYLDLLSAEGFIGFNLNSLDEHIRSLQQQEYQTIATQIEKWIESDPEQQLQNCYPRNCKQCNCQIISYRRLIIDPPDSYKEIANEMGIVTGTLTGHWYKKCLPLLQAQAKKFGYQP